MYNSGIQTLGHQVIQNFILSESILNLQMTQEFRHTEINNSKWKILNNIDENFRRNMLFSIIISNHIFEQYISKINILDIRVCSMLHADSVFLQL